MFARLNFGFQDMSRPLHTPSVNKDGTIVTLLGTEYRWRDGTVFVRNENGNLEHVAWSEVPEQVRNCFSECG